MWNKNINECPLDADVITSHYDPTNPTSIQYFTLKNRKVKTGHCQSPTFLYSKDTVTAWDFAPEPYREENHFTRQIRRWKATRDFGENDNLWLEKDEIVYENIFVTEWIGENYPCVTFMREAAFNSIGDNSENITSTLPVRKFKEREILIEIEPININDVSFIDALREYHSAMNETARLKLLEVEEIKIEIISTLNRFNSRFGKS